MLFIIRISIQFTWKQNQIKHLLLMKKIDAELVLFYA